MVLISSNGCSYSSVEAERTAAQKHTQVIVVRKNLGMRKGKMNALGVHASMGVIIKDIISIDEDSSIMTTKQLMEWVNGSFTKVVVYVDTDEDWFDLLETLDNQDEIPYYVITDNDNIEFKGVMTDTCVAIGPHEEDVINELTGKYKLL